MSRPAAHCGFTLVEMLVALVVFALLGVAATTVLAWTADSREVVAEHSARLAELQRARVLLQGDLSQLAPRRVRSRDGTPARDAFLGATHRSGAGSGPQPLMAFVRRGWGNPDASARASLQYVEYRLVDGRLERATRSALDGAVTGDPRPVLTGITDASIEYHHRGEWNHGWAGGVAELPTAVRLVLQLEDLGRLEQLFLVTGEAA
ncbi:type II secretion system minor pseudopilin GspJ [Lysobacter sp. GX 14042]|uniref:type II secretion system minor pseudopilin GspJ n=1 Tax=Lysobacter sp. GX 14042 TaxID=2907155 RepID=UPI0031BB4F8D